MSKHENNGMTAREALARLGVALDGEGVTWVDLLYDMTLQRPLLDRLVDGTWYATGTKVPITPKSRAARIPSHLWDNDVLGINLHSNTASGGGLEYEGLCIYAFKDPGDIRRQHRPAVGRDRLRDFMKKRIDGLRAAGKRSNARQDEDAAREHFEGRSITRGWISEIRNELCVPAEWSMPGRRKKTGN